MRLRTLGLLGTFVFYGHCSYLEANAAAPKSVIEKSQADSESREEELISFESLWSNPALQSGLRSGSDYLNRSLDSLFEAVFYSILDQEFRFPVYERLGFGIALYRDVYQSSLNRHIVIDTMRLGPEYQKEVAQFYSAPLNLNIELKSAVYNIYPSSFSIQKANDEKSPFWRKIINNWFGVLPFLTNILPPSFNPYQLYDPIKLAENPFLFPFTPNSALAMPIGSIRSYALSRTLDLPIDLAKLRQNGLGYFNRNLGDFDLSVPIGVNLYGESRLNVLRKSATVAWIGLSDQSEVGTYIADFFKSVLTIIPGIYCKNIIPGCPFKIPGLKFPMTPFSKRADLALQSRRDLIYSFDISYPNAKEAYKEAILGDFRRASLMAQESILSGEYMGVRFETHKRSKGHLDKDFMERKLFVQKTSVHEETKQSLATIQDNEGIFLSLENRRFIKSSDWDLLQGTEDKQYEFKQSIAIKNDSEEALMKKQYALDGKSDNPINLGITHKTQFKNIDHFELLKEVERMDRLSGLDAQTLIKGKWDNSALIKAALKELQDSDPDEIFQRPLLITAALGEWQADFLSYFGIKDLNRIAEASSIQKWQAIIEAYGLETQTPPDEQSLSYRFTQVMAGVLLMPLSFFKDLPPDILRFKEANRLYRTLRDLSLDYEHLDQLHDQFQSLIETSYPECLIKALTKLSGKDNIPRSLRFFTKSRGRAPEEWRSQFQKLNLEVLSSEQKFPQIDRANKADEVLSQFEPGRADLGQTKPLIKNLKLKSYPVGESFELVLDLESEGISFPPKIYLRLETLGSLNLSRTLLIEEIMELKPLDSAPTESRHSVKILGSDGLYSNNAGPNKLLEGGEFQLIVAVNSPHEVWSEPTRLSFLLNDGQLSEKVE